MDQLVMLMLDARSCVFFSYYSVPVQCVA